MTKEQLAAKIWDAANEMRSKTKIDADDYKTYLLAFIFYKFLSEKEEKWVYEVNQATEEEFKAITENSDDAQYIRKNIGYFISYDNLFSTWRKHGKEFKIGDVSEALLAFDRNIDEKQKGIFGDIFKDVQSLGLEKFGSTTDKQTSAVKKIFKTINDIPMDANQGYDVLGFVYEYLISNFAAGAGKKGGEFYTPHEVSVLMSDIVAYHLRDKKQIKIFDSTSGSGSLLINIGKSVQKQLNDENSVSYYAQELKDETYNITRMNLIMRVASPSNLNVNCANTLEEDWPTESKTLKPLTSINAIVGNPPYSAKWDSKKYEDKKDPRYKDYGYAPHGKADYAFLLHDLYHLDPDGIMTIVLPHGTLYRGGTEKDIRTNLIEKNNIDAIIGLPANIFYGTGIPTIIMVLKKNKVCDDVLIIDASLGFTKGGKRNVLRARDIKKIADTYNNRVEIENYSRKVSRSEIRENDYNLNIPRYVDTREKPEPYDLYAIMNGGIPKDELSIIKDELNVFNTLEADLVESIDEKYVKLKPSESDVQLTIEVNDSVLKFKHNFENAFDDFDEYLYTELITNVEMVPIQSEENKITDEIFKRLENVPLVDKYEIYQMLDDGWNDIAEDIDKIQREGKQCVSLIDPKMVPIKNKKENGDENEIDEVQKGWMGHIIPFEMVEKDLFSDELETLDQKNNRLNEIQEEYEELIAILPEEDQDDILNDDNTKFVSSEVKKAAKEYLKENIQYDDDSKEAIVIKASKLMDEESKLKREIKTINIDLDAKAKSTIENLTFEESIKYLLEKWISPLLNHISDIPNNIIRNVENKIIYLDKKYSVTMADIENNLKTAEKDLNKMIDDLAGDDNDMIALRELKELLVD